jgi:predicted dehydrogenase
VAAAEATTSTPDAIRVAAVGCGAIAHHHLPALRDLDGVRLVAVADASPAMAGLVAEMYGAERWFDSVGEMLTATQPDVLHVLTPPHTHESMVTMAIEQGCHVVCEKPFALDASTADRLLDLAAMRGVVLVESQNLRWNDTVLAIDALVAAGDLGEVREVDLSLRLDLTAGPFGDVNLGTEPCALPGGAVHDFLPHLVYLFLHYATADRAPIDAVVGELTNRSGNPRVGADSLDVLVRAGTVRGRLHVASDLAPDAFRLTVRGTGRSVESDLYNPFLRVEGGAAVGKFAPAEQVRSGARLITAGARNLLDKVRGHDTMHGLPRFLGEVYGALATGGPPPVGPDAIRVTAASVDAVLDGARGLDPMLRPDATPHPRTEAGAA